MTISLLPTYDTFKVNICSFSKTGILRISINQKMYKYLISPFIYDKFRFTLTKNKGRALAMIRGCEV